MKISVYIQPYVFKYLLSMYGNPPYDLTASKRNDLRLHFQFFRMVGEVIPQSEKLHPQRLVLDLGEDTRLLAAYEQNKEMLASSAANFFQAEFMHALRSYVAAQEAFAVKRMKLPMHLWNKKLAIDWFLQDHGIHPDEYDHFSIYRQLNRLEQVNYPQLASKLRQLYGFAATENQHFKPCNFQLGKSKVVNFYCYSRGREDIVRLRHYIPSKLLRSGDWINYAKASMNIINDYLLKGYSVS